MKKTLVLAAVAITSLGLNANAALLTGTYSIPNISYIVGMPNQAVNNGNGTYGLTSTPTQYFSFVVFTPDQTVTFSQLSYLAAVFTDNSGGAYGGSPRLVVGLSNGGDVNVLLGTSPEYMDGVASLNAYSGVNLIGNNDSGRYDTSNDGLAGGTSTTTYSGAMAQAGLGSLGVVNITFAVDGGWGPNSQNVTLNSIDAAVPEPATMLAGALLLLPFGASLLRIFRKRLAT